MAEILNRVHGTEMEWGILVTDGEVCTTLESLTVSRQAAAYFEAQKMPYLGPANNCFLANGSRFYGDVGDKRETTTPEDISYLSTTASEFANEQLMYELLQTPLKSATGKVKNIGKVTLNKRVVDDVGRTWGYHESYNVPADIAISSEALALLGIHLATRNVYAGAGFLDGKGQFWSAQKASDIKDDFSNQTTRDKPVVNLRPEHHSDPEKSHRVHVTSGDPSMSPWATRMQLGTTSLVLRLMAEGLSAESIDFGPLNQTLGLSKFMRTLAQDTSGSTSTFATALEAQQRLVKNAMFLRLSAEQEWVVSEWDRVLYDLADDPRSAAKRVEWVLRLESLRRFRDNKGVPTRSPVMRERDRQWDYIGPGSIGLHLRESAWSEWMPSQELIDERRTNAPSTTRAAIRSKFIKAFSHRNMPDCNNLRANWDTLIYNGKAVPIKDPYATRSIRVENIIENGLKEVA